MTDRAGSDVTATASGARGEVPPRGDMPRFRAGPAGVGAVSPASRDADQRPVWRRLLSTVGTYFFFKCFGTLGFTFIFFSAYIYLLKNPVFPVTEMPVIWIDRVVPFEALALPIYFSLWLYLSLPPMLMLSRREIVEYGGWIGSLCVFALAIFCFWPTAVPPANIDWGRYPGMGFLKGVDAAGNACPSLHVATAVFSAFWLHWRLPVVGLGRYARLLNAGWCVAIAYSTLATRQHVAVDTIAGAALGVAFALCSNRGLAVLSRTRIRPR
jgi:hypothetical protein